MGMGDPSAKIPVGKCPICGKQAVEQHRPFCSRRCALIDLGRWMGGNYRVPETRDDDEQESPHSEEEENEE